MSAPDFTGQEIGKAAGVERERGMELRGEDLVEVSREVQVSPQELEEWRRVFLEAGQQGLKRRGRDPTERELLRTRAKLGEVTMRMELASEFLEKRGYGDELRKLLR